LRSEKDKQREARYKLCPNLEAVEQEKKAEQKQRKLEYNRLYMQQKRRGLSSQVDAESS
jgi:hypothetical protein